MCLDQKRKRQVEFAKNRKKELYRNLPSIVSNDTIGPWYKHYSLGEEENCLAELC